MFRWGSEGGVAMMGLVSLGSLGSWLCEHVVGRQSFASRDRGSSPRSESASTLISDF